jgi:DNA polymerase-3 subunit epsilon
MPKQTNKPFPLFLDRPLAVIDIESTGTNVRDDRIIDLAVLRIEPDGSRTDTTFRVNPGIPIPSEAAAVHGITDADVAGCPMFKDKAREVFDLLDPCDLAGYNLLRFDIPMLVEELARAGIEFVAETRRVIDAQRIYHQREPRDLSAAVQFYCGEWHIGAHGALADADATLRVLEGQFRRYKDLPNSMDDLHKYCSTRRPGFVDAAGRFRWLNGEVVVNFGKKKGTPLRQLVAEKSSFLQWMLSSDFPRETKKLIENAIQGQWPQPPSGGAEDPA